MLFKKIISLQKHYRLFISRNVIFLITKSVFSDIILVQKIANFQSQSRIIDNKTLTPFVLYS